MADVVLGAKAVHDVTHKVPNLVDALLDRNQVKKLYGKAYESASVQEKAILDAHRDAIKAALAQGTKGNFGPLHRELNKLQDDLDIGLTQAQQKIRDKAAHDMEGAAFLFGRHPS